MGSDKSTGAAALLQVLVCTHAPPGCVSRGGLCCVTGVALNMSTNKEDAPVHASAFGCITVPFLLIALIPLAWGARANWLNGQLARDGDVVTGRVIELRYEPANGSVVRQPMRGGTARGTSPVVTFTTRSGEERTVVGSVNRLPAPWVVGQAVDVVYDPVIPVVPTCAPRLPAGGSVSRSGARWPPCQQSSRCSRSRC